MALLLWITNIEGIRVYWKKWDLREIGPAIPASVIGTFAGAHLISVVPAAELRRLIGFAGIAIGLWGLARLRLLATPRQKLIERLPGTVRVLVAALIGTLAGIAGAIVNAGGVVLSVYLLIIGSPKERFVANTMLFLMVADSAKLVAFARASLFGWYELGMVALAIPVMFIGAYAGRWVNARLTIRGFDAAISTALVGMGFLLLVRS